MLLVQRSGDMLTASGPGGINEIQYAALLMMIARHTGYKPGKFSHIVANEQIYDRHIDAAKEMLKRFNDANSNETNIEFYWDTTPMLYLNENKTNFFEMTIDDFILLGYEPMKPQLKLELGI
jgi:thymidylate synthase